MRDTLIIDGAVLLKDCEITPEGWGTFLHVESTPELEFLLRGHHIIFTNMESKYYTGKVNIYKNEKGLFVLSLVDMDYNVAREKCMRIITIKSALFVTGMITAVSLFVWLVL